MTAKDETWFGWAIHAWGSDPAWTRIEPQPPAPDEVVVEVEACGVGRTVLNYIGGAMGSDPSNLPRVPGHEFVGRVVLAGSEAADLMGARVAAYFYLICGSCDPCRRGEESGCENRTGWVGVHRDGGYAQLATLPARNVIPISEELDAAAATVIPDAVATPVHVTRRAEIGPGDRVAVIGAGGGVGIHMIQVAAAAGAAVAGLESTAEKLDMITRLGAGAVQVAAIADLAPGSVFDGESPTVIVDFVGSDDTLRWSVGALASFGRMVVVTTFADTVVEAAPRELVRREISILGSRYASKADFRRAHDLVLAGTVTPVVGRVIGPDEVIDVHEEIRRGQLLGRGAILWS